MENIETTPKRGRPANNAGMTQQNNPVWARREAAALAVLQGIITSSANVVDKPVVMRYCFELADAFIEVADE